VRRLAAAAALGLALLAGTARADTFAVVSTDTPALPSLTGLPSAQVPNGQGVGLPVPATFTTAPTQPQQLTYPQLSGLWQRAGAAYGVPWQVLASINKIESNFGRNMGPSSAGAIGWMQFMPSTWVRWGTDANGDGVADPWNAEDAIFSAARYLAAAGGSNDIASAIYSYNHADWYVNEVLSLAQVYGQGGEIAFSLDRLQIGLQQAQDKIVEANRRLVAEQKVSRALARAQRPWLAREQSAQLLSDRLAAGKQAGILAARRALADQEAARLQEELDSARVELELARRQSQAASFSQGAGTLLQAQSYSGNWVFPVGGGPSVVSVAHTHHDYPAADIAAPAGSPVYALADAVVLRSWQFPDVSCGIGLTLRTGDGQVWTYCHLAWEDPAVQPGVQLTAGQSVGLVGSTGHSTGPHLHLQLDPATSYPQDQSWFRSFAGTAFRWQDAPTPLEPGARGLASSTGGAPLFRVVPQTAPAPVQAPSGVVLFTR
jgi:murein DD-endopeptidase MepM/ murein hydrolase activator NlpD